MLYISDTDQAYLALVDAKTAWWHVTDNADLAMAVEQFCYKIL